MIKAILRKLIVPLYAYKEKKYRSSFGKIGQHTVVQSNSQLVPKNMYLDDYVLIQDHNNFISHRGKLIVKKYSVISSGCIIVPSTHKLIVGVPFFLSAMKHVGDEDHEIIIEEDCWIGAGVILLPGVTIGRGCVIGAGSVVTKDIPPYAVAVGTPARIIATKFSKSDILIHEKLLYPVEERFSPSFIDDLFQSKFVNKEAIGDALITEFDKVTVDLFFKKQAHENGDVH